MHALEAAGVSIVREMEMEGALHITSFTTRQCMERYGAAPDLFDPQQPAAAGSPHIYDSPRTYDNYPEHLEAPIEQRLEHMQDFTTGQGVQQELAACLATPAEAIQEREGRQAREGGGGVMRKLLLERPTRWVRHGRVQLQPQAGRCAVTAQQCVRHTDGQPGSSAASQARLPISPAAAGDASSH
jgi:hypothetical protein